MMSKRTLQQELAAAIDESLDRPTFVELYQRVIVAFDIKDYEVARVEKIAIGTAIRWRTGIAAPRQKNRSAVLRALLHIIEMRSMSAAELLCRAAETSEKRTVSVGQYQMVSPAWKQKDLAGKRAKLLVAPAEDDKFPSGLPVGTQEVVVLDNTPSPHGVLRVSPPDNPRIIGLVMHDQLAIVE